MNNRIVVLFALAVLYFSCEGPAIVKLPEIQPRIVLNCLAENQERWVVELNESAGILTNHWGSLSSNSTNAPFNPVWNATVNIYENDLEVESVQFSNNGKYVFNSFPTAGNNYRVEVSAPSYESVSAYFTLPSPVAIDSLVVTILGPNTKLGFENYKDIQIRVYFNDPPGANYYAISVFRSDAPVSTSGGGLILLFTDPIYESETIQHDPGFGSGVLTFNDTKFEGKRKYFDFKSFIVDDDNPFYPPLNFYTATLQSVTKDYYDYLLAASLQKAVRNDPYGQPLNIPSNIKNGFGIFAGQSSTTKTIEVKN